MANCEYIVTKGFEFDCDNIIQPGLEQDAWIFNREDVTASYNATNKMLITDFTLPTGKTGYRVQQLGDAYTGTTTSMNEGTFVNTFNRTVAFIVPKNDPVTAAKILDKLANGEFVMVVQNKFHSEGEQNRFEIYGLEKGLKAASIDEDKYSEETNSGWQVTLTETGNAFPAQFLYKTNEATTLSRLNTLCPVA